MIPLSEIREQLDEIDSQIVRLYEKRMEIVHRGRTHKDRIR